MKQAYLNLRLTKPDRVEAFARGLRLNGYKVIPGHTMTPGPQDIFVTWNRIGIGASAARAFEAAGCPVLVAENASWGNDFADSRWYHIARNRHNTAGRFDDHGPERWDSLGVDLAPWRTQGETVILAQRGIGAAPTAMPRSWPQEAQARYGGRIRHHPGTRSTTALRDDLVHCGRVVTWGSGAAIKALLWGIPVVSEMPDWIGDQQNDDESRLNMFRRLAWAQWTMDEISEGLPFRCLL